MFTGYLLSEHSRNILLEKFKPSYERVVCHHITQTFGVAKDTPIPEAPESCQAVGYINDEKGVEGFLVAINGSTIRPDGKSHYHITHSLANDRKPVETNNFIDIAKPITPIDLDVMPKNFWNE